MVMIVMMLVAMIIYNLILLDESSNFCAMLIDSKTDYFKCEMFIP